MAKNYWLFKSEPDVYSIEDLRRDKSTFWEGVRNYQARNFLRDRVQPGDGVLFYHSRVEPMAVVGVAEVTKGGYPDPTQFDEKSKYFDPKSTRENPRWFVVDIAFGRFFKRPVPLHELKKRDDLSNMVLVNRSRLSVQPVKAQEWKIITKLGAEP